MYSKGGEGVFKAELRPAEVDPRFRKRETKIALSKKTNTLKQVVERGLKLNGPGLKVYESMLIQFQTSRTTSFKVLRARVLPHS